MGSSAIIRSEFGQVEVHCNKVASFPRNEALMAISLSIFAHLQIIGYEIILHTTHPACN